jgi:ATP-dependent DNA helicase RecG
MFFRALDKKVSHLKGIGKAAQTALESQAITTCGDLLLLSPRSFEDRSIITPLGKIPHTIEEPVTVNTVVIVTGYDFFGSGSKRTLKIIAQDVSGKATGRIELLCFGRNFLQRTIKEDHVFYLYATGVSRRGYTLQTGSFELTEMKLGDTPPPPFGEILPIYPLRGSLTQRILRNAIKQILRENSAFEEELSPFVSTRFHLMDTDTAIRTYHFPQDMDERQEARRSLAFTELFYMQLISRRGIGNKQHHQKKSHPTELENRFIATLPFALTADQITVLRQIRADLDAPIPMNRMLQGDVGSGKTLVAWVSSLHVLSQNGQVAFMAPTELLAVQHAENADKMLTPFGIRVGLLLGGMKAKEKKHLLSAIKEGEIDIVIGTHALFSDVVAFASLKYVIIDEQHRFGVEQRELLMKKGKNPHILMMSATPIPRTLALTIYGNLEVSTIKSMPHGRKKVITHLVNEASRVRMYKSIGVEFTRGHQAYFVYPRIDDSGQSELRDVTNMFEYLKKQYPGIPSALLHSKIDDEEKLKILEQFKKKEIMYLVSTSVIEVGIDIPMATCIIIEHADRFGLSALHQLRGRVGRSSLQSYCFLVFSDNLSDDAIKRLKTMRSTGDGFEIAEEDLKIRGPGELLGTRQSGYLKLHFASLTDDLELIKQARDCCDTILKDDPGLLKAENRVYERVLEEANPFPPEEKE